MVETKIFTVEIRHFVPGELPTRILLETDEQDYAEATAQLGIFPSWELVDKNF